MSPFRCASSLRHGCALAVELRAFPSAATLASHKRFRPSIPHVLL